MHRRYGGHLVLCNRHGSCSPQAQPENVITGQSLGRNVRVWRLHVDPTPLTLRRWPHVCCVPLSKVSENSTASY